MLVAANEVAPIPIRLIKSAATTVQKRGQAIHIINQINNYSATHCFLSNMNTIRPCLRLLRTLRSFQLPDSFISLNNRW
jgi:hypothetical protein